MLYKKVILDLFSLVKNMRDYNNKYENGVHVLEHSDQFQINKTSKQPESNQNTKKQNERKKQNNAMHGYVYQTKLLMLFFYRIQRRYSFRLGTEIAEATAFDDLVLEYIKDNKKIYRLLQAKHKLKEYYKITEHELLSKKGDYSLIKYFFSYQKLKNDKFFKNSTIKDIIIYTNIDLDFENLKNANIEFEKIEDEDDILDMKFIEKQPARYMFKNNVASLLKDKIEKYNKENITEKNINYEIDEIKDFLNHLVFAVNQPNQEELGNIIQKEIGEEFNITKMEIVYNRFFIKMLNWMLDPEKDRFLSYEEGKKFFEEKIKFSVFFQLKNLIFSFSGRIEQLFNLHEIQNKNENEIEQNISCVNDLGGINKNELIRKNIEEYNNEYDDKVIWTNGETYEVFPMNSSSMSKLAEKYKSEYEFDYDIENFSPPLFLKYNKLHILIISCNTKWPKNIYALDTFNKTLDMFNKKEAIEFIIKLFNIDDNTKKNNIKEYYELMKQLHYFLLALQQVIIFINRQNKKLKNITTEFNIHNYLNEKKDINKKQRNLNFQNLIIIKIDYIKIKDYIKIIFNIWNITLDIIEQMIIILWKYWISLFILLLKIYL